MGTQTFSGVEACVFDAYGTLFDVHSAVARHRARLGEQADAVSELWRAKQLQYTWLRSLMSRHADFWQVTGDALDYALDSHGVDNAALRDDLMQAYLSLSCYSEVPEVLRRLRAAGLRTAILSNGSPEMLTAAVASAGLRSLIDLTLSIEEVGIYKPDPRVYELAGTHLGLRPEQMSFQSSNAWDAVGAAAFGFQVAWVNRFGQRRERLEAEPQAELRTLSELPALVGLVESDLSEP